MDSLFQPLHTAQLDLRNRVLMAPLTRNRAPQGLVGELHELYYRQRAGAGLIVTEATAIYRGGRSYMGEPLLSNDEEARAWSRVTRAVHSEGGRIFVQLHHGGRMSHPGLTRGVPPVAPSAVRAKGHAHLSDGSTPPYPVPEALNGQQIENILDAYANSARLAMRAGFDGVELHAANGYLPHQFLGINSNLRQDGWGKTIEGRARFTLEALERMSDAIGARHVAVKLSPGGFPHHDLYEEDSRTLYRFLAERLARLGLAYVHIQQPILDRGMEPLSFDSVADFKQAFGGTVFAGGSFDAESAREAVRTGRADAVFFGRAFIANPDLPERIRGGHELTAPDPSTFYTPGPRGYVDYPSLRPVLAEVVASPA